MTKCLFHAQIWVHGNWKHVFMGIVHQSIRYNTMCLIPLPIIQACIKKKKKKMIHYIISFKIKIGYKSQMHVS